MKKTIIIGLIGILAVVGVVWGVMGITYGNEEIRLRETMTAKIEVNQSSYSKMWEILTTQAGVSTQYAKDFKEIYPELIEGRYSNGQGRMMSWIQEHNPNFDISLYNKLMRSIEAQRESFHTNQTQLADLSRQHRTLLREFPSRIFLTNIEDIDVPIVINDETVEAFKNEREVEMELFPE